MFLKAFALAAIVSLASCATSPEATKLVNRSNAPLEVVFVVKGADAPQMVRVEAGESRLLGADIGLADYASVEFRGADKNVIFRDSDLGWRDSRCGDDCAFIWLGNGKVAITA